MYLISLIYFWWIKKIKKMDDIKLDYLERMKALLEKDDIPNLNKFIVRIKPKVDNDPTFQ